MATLSGSGSALTMSMIVFSDEYDDGDCVTLPVDRNSSIPLPASVACLNRDWATCEASRCQGEEGTPHAPGCPVRTCQPLPLAPSSDEPCRCVHDVP